MNSKEGALRSDVQLQPHQQRLTDEAARGPFRKLLYHSLGSGKTPSALSIAETRGGPYTFIAPASLRANIQKEREKFTDLTSPTDVMSYTGLAKGQPVDKLNTLAADEAQRLKNFGSKTTQRFLDLANQAENVVLMSGTPIQNHPTDLVPLIAALTKKPVTPAHFTRRFLQTKQTSPGILGTLLGMSPGEEEDVAHPNELKALLRGHVDYYESAKPPADVNYEDIPVEMSPLQSQLWKAMWGKLPWYLRLKLKWNVGLTDEELRKARGFLSGPRQVGLSVYPFLRKKDPLKAFEQSPKLQKAMELVKKHLAEPEGKALYFSNFIDAGITPLAAALERDEVPHAVFHGGLSDVERKQLVNSFNNNLIRVALLGPSGAEGLSFKGTRGVVIGDSHWHSSRGKQSEGRALRFDSHAHLPEELRNVKIYRLISRLPPGLVDRLMSNVGIHRTDSRRATDDYLRAMSAKKDKLNNKFLKILQEVGSEGKEPMNPEKKAGVEDYADWLDPVRNPLGYAGGGIAAALGYMAVRKALEQEKIVEPEEVIKQRRQANPLLAPIRRVWTFSPMMSRKWYRRAVEAGEAGVAGSSSKTAASDDVRGLLERAKAYSDGRSWYAKHTILRQLMERDPSQWRVDGDRDKDNVGISHRSGYRFHLPPRYLAGLELEGLESL